MKSRLIWLQGLLFISLVSIIGLISINGNRSVVIALGIVATIIALVTLYTWMRFVSLVAKQSSKFHGALSYDTWNWNNFEAIRDNHDTVDKKFKVAADSIANLSKEENDGIDMDLIANDPIGQSLQKIRVEMKKLKEEETQRLWINQGLTKFGDILRNKKDLKEYSYEIISQLIKYLNANQGGLYIEYNDEGRYLDLAACYAYERKKFVNARIPEGQGLLGQCMLEKDIIYMTDVPGDYISITSGLGHATPRSIVIVPLMENEVFYGAIEIASFEVLRPFQLDFLKKVCENIASEIASIKNIQHTQKLLNASQQLTQELQSREEEMRQSMEELAATQEEMARKQTELTSVMNAIDLTIATAEFDMTGTFNGANEIFLKVLGYQSGELRNQSFPFFMGEDHNTTMMWENLKLGKPFSGEFKMKDRTGKELWLTGTFNPITLDGNVASKIMMFAQFTTLEKEKLNDLTEMVHALKAALPVVELNEKFECKTANEKFLKLFGLNRLNLKSKTILDFIDPYYHGAWKKNQSEILHTDLTIKLPMKLADHTTSYEVNFFPVHNLEGKVSKVAVLLIREVYEVVPVLAVG